MPTKLKTAARAVAVAGEPFRVARDLRRNARLYRPAPPSEGLVLDVGSGQRATPRADLVVDKYIADDFERTGNLGVDVSRPLVVADAEALPFADRAFSYVVASHVLEHARDPERFAGELSRVATAGYVEVPSREAELTFGWPYHPWLIDRDGEALVFSGRGDAKAPVGEVFHRAAGGSRSFNVWFAQNRTTFHHAVHWRGTLSVRRDSGEPSAQTAAFDVAATTARIKELASGHGLHGPTGTVRDVLRCPLDHGTLTWTDDRATCDVCGAGYPVVSGVPMLLAEAAQR